MPLSRQDCVESVRQVEGLLREYDPSSLESVLRSTEHYNDPRRYLVELLRTVRHLYAERSSGTYGPILDTMNRFVRLEDGSPVRGISVALSPAEREIYEREEISFAELPDSTVPATPASCLLVYSCTRQTRKSRSTPRRVTCSGSISSTSRCNTRPLACEAAQVDESLLLTLTREIPHLP